MAGDISGKLIESEKDAPRLVNSCRRCRDFEYQKFLQSVLLESDISFNLLKSRTLITNISTYYLENTMIAPVGQAVPDTPHAVSVSLPTWKANVGYEEGEEWVISAMKTGYPRFFIHLLIQELERDVLAQFGNFGERVMLFPSRRSARKCQAFFYDKRPDIPSASVRLLHLEPDFSKGKVIGYVLSNLSCCFFPAADFPIAKQVWQHTGLGISSRRAEFCLQALRQGFLVPAASHSPQNASQQDLFSKGPKRYQRGTSQNNISLPADSRHEHATNGVNGTNGVDSNDYAQFIEERFGRNLNAELAAKAKLAIRRRIAGCLTENMELDDAIQSSTTCQDRAKQGQDGPGTSLRNVSEEDVYLYPTGMGAIFSAHQLAIQDSESRTSEHLKSICFGFPYIDTLKVLEKWGPGALFYPQGIDADLDDLQKRLEEGERFAALFTEFPSNPLLRSPNLARIRQLADKYKFVVAVDETVGNYININILPYADIVMSSLTKIFSGDSNVMGGSLILNHRGPLYSTLKPLLQHDYEDNYWAVDAIFMERNSRDYIGRIHRINTNADAMTQRLKQSKYVKEVYYPKINLSRNYYDACKTPEGGYGGLYSVVFHDPEHAHIFFDNLQIQKGPSLGTNFSLSCPFVLIAHYNELDWCRSLGVDPDLVRVSVGLEDPVELARICDEALAAIERS